MNEKDLQEILIQILYCSLNGISDHPGLRGKLTPEVIVPVYKLANKHSLAHLVSRYAFGNRLEIAPDIAGRFQQDAIKCVYRHERMKHAYQQICYAFEEAKIDYIPLKGSVLRGYYPDESMRTSCDIDILVRETELDRAVSVLEQKQFHRGERFFHNISLYAPNGTHLELHFSILENKDQLDQLLKNAWDHARPEEGCRHRFREDFFVFHQFAHMAYHFLSGGCGIRSLMDIWVMEHRMDLTYACAEKLLKKAGIYRFAAEMTKIANQCFSHQDASDPVLPYIWRGGVYGTKKNEVMVQQLQEGSSSVYIWKRLLMPYSSMVILYPILKKLPILLPFCWVHRWIRAIFRGKTRKIVSEFAFSHQMSDADGREIMDICRRLGFE